MCLEARFCPPSVWWKVQKKRSPSSNRPELPCFKPRQNLPQDHSNWKKPLDGWIKLNWDAAIDRQHNLMGVGLIARDSTEKVPSSMCYYIPYLTDPSTAEAYAVWQVVELCRDMGFQGVMLEGDAQVIMMALTSDDA